MKSTSFAIYGPTNKTSIGHLIDKTLKTMLGHHFVYQDDLKDKPEIVIVFGGDGMMLEAIHHYDFTPSFILINAGHLGFFSDYKIIDLDRFLEDILYKEEIIEEIPLFEAIIDNEKYYFVSDISIQSEKTALFSLDVNLRHLGDSQASGIVIGTPVSSTAFLGSLGSPSILTYANIYQYSLIAPIHNKLFPLMIDKGILFNKDVLSIKTKGQLFTYLDGIKVKKEGKEFIIKMSERKVKLFHLYPRDNFDRIVDAIKL